MTDRGFSAPGLLLAAALFASIPPDGGLRAEAAAATSQPTVKLLDAGGGAKKTLRFAPSKGARESVVMTMQMDMTLDMGGFPMPKQKIPIMALTLDVEVTDVAADGDITYDFRFAKAEVRDDEGVQPMVATAMRTQLKSLEGLSGSAVVTSRGFTEKADMEIPATASSQVRQMLESMRQSMQQFSAPVPEEPIGVGARWQVITELDQNGLKIEQVATYEVVGLEGTTARLKTEVAQKAAADQQVSPPGLAPGMKLKVLSLKSEAEGETELVMSRILPKKARTEVKNETRMEMAQGEQSQKMTTRMDMRVTMESAKPSGADAPKAEVPGADAPEAEAPGDGASAE